MALSLAMAAGCTDSAGMQDATGGRVPLQQVSGEIQNSGNGDSNTIVGRWYQTGRGNGAKIWYDFQPDGTFTFNYDMMGNRDNVQNRGNWRYLGNSTYRLVSGISGEPDTHGNENITLSQDRRSFCSGTISPLPSGTTREIVFVKE